MHKKAFTLIELLVVIAIIAILAAILFPVFAQAKASAKKASRLSDMKQVSLAGRMYATDYDDVTMFIFARCVDGESFIDENGIVQCTTIRRVGWPQIIHPYTKSDAILIDSSGAPAVFPRDLSTNLENFGSGPNMAGNWHTGRGVADSSVERPSELISFSEAYARDWFGTGILVRAAHNLNPWDWRDIWGTGMDVTDGSRRSIRCVQYHKKGDAWFQNHYDPQDAWSPDWRYQDSANFPFFDGHAKAIKMGGLKAENFYPNSIPDYALEPRDVNCDGA